MIDKIENVKNERRYYFPIKWIFPTPQKHTVSAFCKKNFETGFHVQSFYEIVFITRGYGYHFIGNDTHRVEVGDLFVVPPGVRHALSGGEGFDVHHFHFNPYFINRFISMLKDMPFFLTLFEAHKESVEQLITDSTYKYRHIKLQGAEYEEMLSAFDELIDYIYNHIPYDTYIAECKAAIIVTLLCREFSKLPESIIEKKKDDSFFEKSLFILKERYEENHTIEELCTVAKMSRTTYVKHFRAKTGTSPREYLIEQRIKRASALLESTDMTVARIAEAVGFYDISHLIKQFKKKLGVTPDEYRRKLDERN